MASVPEQLLIELNVLAAVYGDVRLKNGHLTISHVPHAQASLSDLQALRNAAFHAHDDNAHSEIRRNLYQLLQPIEPIHWPPREEERERPFEWNYAGCWHASLDDPQSILQSTVSPDEARSVSGGPSERLARLRLRSLIRLLSRAITELLRIGATRQPVRTAFQSAIRWHLNHGCHPPALDPTPQQFSPGFAA